MRLDMLKLIKYGKFENEVLSFPSAPFDFHVIVGPNEAGKSTLRTAISDLLFGMKLNTPLGFHHGITELRIGGKIEGGPGSLEFHRARGRSTLRTPTDDKLPDDALVTYLLGATREFFEQMFGLDHTRLIQGGESILDASDKIGQVLFESAVGIGSLGPVRENLDQKAAEIWSPRSKSCLFGLAESALNQSTADMKAALVRTKEWHQLKVGFDELCGEIDNIRSSLQVLEQKRTKLERVRRLAPFLNGLSEKESNLVSLGIVVDLPDDAVDRLHVTQRKIATSKGILEERLADLSGRNSELALLTLDEDTLGLVAEIENLSSLRGSCINHPRDLPLRQAELKGYLREVADAASQLGWPEEERALREALPTTLSIKSLVSLLRSHSGIVLALQNAKDALEERQREFKDFQEQLSSLSKESVPDNLRHTLSEARTFKNYAGAVQTLENDIESTGRSAEAALDALGRWRLPIDQLRKLDLPSSERIHSLQKEASEVNAAITAANQAVRSAKAEVERWTLQTKHFSQDNRVVTQAEVQMARVQRDTTWSDIKGGSLGLADGSQVLDNAIRLSDELVDTKLSTTEEAAQLQSYRQNLETANSNLALRESECQERVQTLAQFQATWIAISELAGVPGMVLEDVQSWMRKRDAAILAQGALELKQGELVRLRGRAEEGRAALFKNLQGVGQGREADSLSALIELAERFVQSIDIIGAQRESLMKQTDQAQRALQTAQARYKVAKTELDDWTSLWTNALRSSKLEGVCPDLAAAEAAIGLVERIETNLKSSLGPAGRITGMQSDLKTLTDQASRLASQLEPDLLKLGDSFEISRRLVERLSIARENQRNFNRLVGEIRAIEKKVKEIREDIAVAEAQVKPLLERASVLTLEECIPLAEKANKNRVLKAEVDKARLDLIHDGEGMTFEAISAEVGEFDLSQVPILLEQTKTSIAELTEKHAGLLQRQATEGKEFGAINGQATAAIAEARRHEALAALGDAAEQYVELTTAQRLLKWAIERYRDQKQGPMLRRAGEIFAGLTLGEFTKLVVESEKSPPELFAKRVGGHQIEVAGLSEGTRDQLFLALRIAALELQISSKLALPFIADDLFVNFDDERAKAGFEALKALSGKTQVLFLTHHDHLLPIIRGVFGADVNVLELKRSPSLISV
jgi:chromosome segregation protein